MTRRCTPWILLACSLFSIPVGSSGAPESAGPVPLYTPRPRTPVEAAGTDLAPEMRIRVEVDERGRVTRVEVFDIVPSSPLDESYRRAATESLLSWRYFPAQADGKPVSTRLEWTLKFPPRRAEDDAAGGTGDARSSWQLTGAAEDSDRRYRRHVLSLPAEERLELQKAFVAVAESHLNPSAVKEYATGRVIALTDAPDADVARVLAANIESTFNILTEMLRPGVEPQPEPHKIAAVMYAQERSFRGLAREVRANEKWSGFYNPAGLLAFHMGMPSNESLTGLLLHEATHAYIDRYLTRPGVVFPRWLDEGFAEYIGNSTIRKKQLVPGKTRRTEAYRGPWGIQPARSGGVVTTHQVRDAVRAGSAISLTEIVSASPHEFYGERSKMYYAMSWLLVHFLRHGEEGWADEKFPRLMLYVAEGYPALEAVRQIYGEPEGLEPRFHAYLMEF
jgi:hypothetical protein